MPTLWLDWLTELPVKGYENQVNGYRICLFINEPLHESDLVAVVEKMANIYRGEMVLSEARAVILPSESELIYDGIKIKGAGLNGGAVQLGQIHQGTYDIPYYDYEGNYSIDAARGHHRPYAGGMSFQQALNEFNVTRFLNKKSVDTYQAIGYGSIERVKTPEERSWFCLLGCPFKPYWSWNRPTYDQDLVWLIPEFVARMQNQLYEEGLMLLLHGPTNIKRELARKDFHTARFRTENDSSICVLSYFLFDTNFILATFANKIFDTGHDNWVEFAWKTYIETLSGDSHSMNAISEFKSLLVTLKTNDQFSVAERIKLVRSDAIAANLLLRFLSIEERHMFSV